MMDKMVRNMVKNMIDTNRTSARIYSIITVGPSAITSGAAVGGMLALT
jgi:hypothetical protein